MTAPPGARTGRLGIVGLGSYAPGRPLTVGDLSDIADPLSRSPLFRPPDVRHHLDDDRAAVDMVTAAVTGAGLMGRVTSRVGVLMTNTLLPDTPITGIGASVAARVGVVPHVVLDVHNSGCAAFPYMLMLAERLVDDGGDAALLCAAQNGAGQSFRQHGGEVTSRSLSHGDAAAAVVLQRGEGCEVLGTAVIHDPDSSADMGTSCRTRRYWEAGSDTFDITFNESATREIMDRGNTLVPRVVSDLCERIGVPLDAIDVLITNQPSRIFLRNWRDALGVSPERHFDTYDRFGNLYGAGIPVSLTNAAAEGRLRPGDLVVVAGFAHAGDLAAAAAIRWEDSHATHCSDRVDVG